jgi:hypothetical protein
MPEGIRFRETMAGAFALGAATPEAGARQGEREGHRLAMYVEVEIPDLGQFLAQGGAGGRLGGEIEFSAIAPRMPAPQGVFQLFTPAQDGVSRRMVYELAVQWQGVPHYLAGEKQVRDDPGFDLWSDTTTLYTRLHEGRDRSGRVVGAGVLRLGVPQLLAMVASMRATGDGGTGTVMRFGRFFFGQLWDVYAPHALGGKAGA